MSQLCLLFICASKYFLIDHHCKSQTEFSDLLAKGKIYWCSRRAYQTTKWMMQVFERNFRSVNFHVSQFTCTLDHMSQGGSSGTGIWLVLVCVVWETNESGKFWKLSNEGNVFSSVCLSTRGGRSQVTAPRHVQTHSLCDPHCQQRERLAFHLNAFLLWI